MSARKTILSSILGGLLLFLITYGGVLHAIVAPPPGYVPAYSEQTRDMGAYMSWLADAQTQWLLPNRHVPYVTEAALFQPMVMLIVGTGKLLHIPAVASYYLWQIALLIGAVYGLLLCAQTFLATKRQWFAAACIVACSLPIFMYPYGFRPLAGPGRFGLLGVKLYAYLSSDGLFRAGLSNGPNLTFGTMTMLLAFAFLARYVKNERRTDFFALCACTFANSLLHPFEFYVFVTSALVCLALFRFQEGRLKSALPLAAGLLLSSAAGMLPHLVQTTRSQWLKDASDANQGMMSPNFILLAFGLPTLALAYLFLMRWRVHDKLDVVLLCWIVVTTVFLAIQAIPCGVHLLDGFVYGQAILLVRKAMQDPQLPRLFTKIRRGALAASYALVGFSVFTLGAMWLQIYHDGVAAEPEFLNAIQSKDEAHVLAWLKNNAPSGSLVLAPEQLAPWIPTVSMHAYGSHDVLSVRWLEQINNLEQLYNGNLSPDRVREFLERYGFRYAVVPSSSKLEKELPGKQIERFGSLDLYEFANHQMKPYPVAGLMPERGQNSFRHALLRAVASLLKMA